MLIVMLLKEFAWGAFLLSLSSTTRPPIMVVYLLVALLHKNSLEKLVEKPSPMPLRLMQLVAILVFSCENFEIWDWTRQVVSRCFVSSVRTTSHGGQFWLSIFALMSRRQKRNLSASSTVATRVSIFHGSASLGKKFRQLLIWFYKITDILIFLICTMIADILNSVGFVLCYHSMKLTYWTPFGPMRMWKWRLLSLTEALCRAHLCKISFGCIVLAQKLPTTSSPSRSKVSRKVWRLSCICWCARTSWTWWKSKFLPLRQTVCSLLFKVLHLMLISVVCAKFCKTSQSPRFPLINSMKLWQMQTLQPTLLGNCIASPRMSCSPLSQRTRSFVMNVLENVKDTGGPLWWLRMRQGYLILRFLLSKWLLDGKPLHLLWKNLMHWLSSNWNRCTWRRKCRCQRHITCKVVAVRMDPPQWSPCEHPSRIVLCVDLVYIPSANSSLRQQFIDSKVPRLSCTSLCDVDRSHAKPPTTTTSCGATASRPIRSIPTRPSISSWPPTPGSTSPSLLITMPCNSEATWAITPSPGPKRTHYGQMTMHMLVFTRTMHWLVSWYGWKNLLQSINQSDAVHIYIYIYLIFVYVCKRIFIYIYISLVFSVEQLLNTIGSPMCILSVSPLCLERVCHDETINM